MHDIDMGLGRSPTDPAGILRLVPSGTDKIEMDRVSKGVLKVMATLEKDEVMPEDLPQQLYEVASELETQVKKMTVVKAPPKAAGPSTGSAGTPKTGGTPAEPDEPDLPDEPF